MGLSIARTGALRKSIAGARAVLVVTRAHDEVVSVDFPSLSRLHQLVSFVAG